MDSCHGKLNEWRLLLSGGAHPAFNMALDESILESVRAKKSPPTIRFYRWTPPGISIGCFQNAEEIIFTGRCAQENIPYVKRMTGGEAIFHGDDLSYSIACSDTDLAFPRSVKESFRLLASFLINAYRGMGLDPYFFGDRNESAIRERSDFCFALRQDFDIAINGKKLGGNAQKRMRHLIFQHGSIPIKIDLDGIQRFFHGDIRSAHSHITSLSDVGRIYTADELCVLLAETFRRTFDVRLTAGAPSSEESLRASNLCREKYDKPVTAHPSSEVA